MRGIHGQVSACASGWDWGASTVLSNNTPRKQTHAAPTTAPAGCRFVQYVLGRVDMLRGNGVEAYIIFDGGRLPAKGEEEATRRRCAEAPASSTNTPTRSLPVTPRTCCCHLSTRLVLRSRQEARQRAAAHMAAGNINAALECCQRGVDVTPAMAKQVIEVGCGHSCSSTHGNRPHPTILDSVCRPSTPPGGGCLEVLLLQSPGHLPSHCGTLPAPWHAGAQGAGRAVPGGAL